MLWLTLLLASIVSLPASAHWSTVPEFESLGEEEASKFEGPSDLGPEYPSDLLAYTRPYDWEYRWLATERRIELGFGSISATHFLIQHRLKLRGRLTENLEFRFTYLDERSRELASRHAIFEFIYWPWSWLGLGLYGEPSLYKREDDTGIAFFYRPQPNHELRFFNTFVDVTRLRRSDRRDVFIEPSLPNSRGFVGRWHSLKSPGDFLTYAARYDTRTRWRFPDAGYEYRYWKAFASAFHRRAVSDTLRVSGRAQFDRKLESREMLDGSSRESWLTTRLFANARVEWSGGGPGGWELWPGLEYAERRWRTDRGVAGVSDARYRDWLPYLWLRVPAFTRGASRDELHFGYSSTWHRIVGPVEAFDPGDDTGTQHRLNIVYEFRFDPRAAAGLRLIVTGDLDEFGTARSWDGGAAQFEWDF